MPVARLGACCHLGTPESPEGTEVAGEGETRSPHGGTAERVEEGEAGEEAKGGRGRCKSEFALTSVWH